MLSTSKKKYTDLFTLIYADSETQNKYMVEKYNFRVLVVYSVLIFIIYIIVLGLYLHLMLATKDIEYSIYILIGVAIPAAIMLICWIILMFKRTSNKYYNIIYSIVYNLSIYIIFENMKMISAKYWNDEKNILILDGIQFIFRIVFILIFEDCFIINLGCFIVFIIFYFVVYKREYEGSDNDEVYYILYNALVIFVCNSIERSRKSEFIQVKNKILQTKKNMDLMDNVKSGYLVISITDDSVTSNKAFKKVFFPNLIRQFETEGVKIWNDDDDEERPLIDNEYEHYYSTYKLKKEIKRDKELTMKAALNCIFTSSNKVNSYDFNGELYKEIQKLNGKDNNEEEGLDKATEFSKVFRKSKFVKNMEGGKKERTPKFSSSYFFGGLLKEIIKKYEIEIEEREKKEKLTNKRESISLGKEFHQFQQPTAIQEKKRISATHKSIFKFSQKMHESRLEKEKIRMERRLRDEQEFLSIMLTISKNKAFLSSFKYIIMKSIDIVEDKKSKFSYPTQFNCMIMCRYDEESGTIEFLLNEVNSNSNISQNFDGGSKEYYNDLAVAGVDNQNYNQVKYLSEEYSSFLTKFLKTSIKPFSQIKNFLKNLQNQNEYDMLKYNGNETPSEKIEELCRKNVLSVEYINNLLEIILKYL